MKKITDEFREPSVFLSLIDTGTSTIRMLFKIWEAVQEENHTDAKLVTSNAQAGAPPRGMAA